MRYLALSLAILCVACSQNTSPVQPALANDGLTASINEEKEASKVCAVAAEHVSEALLSKNIEKAKKVFESAVTACSPDTSDTSSGEADLQSIPELPKATGVKTEWRKSIDKSEMTDEKSVYLSLSGTGYTDKFGRSARPSIHLRCHENTTSMYISWGEFLGDDTSSVYRDEKYMRMRFDKNEPFKRLYAISTDNEAAGLWSGGEAIPFIKSMYGKQKLVVEVTPYGESPRQTSFNISGTEQEAVELREACGW